MENNKSEDFVEPVSEAELSLASADKETIDALNLALEDAYKQISGLGDVVKSQNILIQDLKQRLKDHGIFVLEKSIVETTREELKKINASIPKHRTVKAGTPGPQPTMAETLVRYAEDDEERQNNVFANMLGHMASGVDLEKHGIDPVTLCFKPGYGPNGKIETPAPAPKKSLFMRIMNRLGFFRV